ncbi:hypothetical protein ACFLZX_00230 [Nanoarchaeota archaeon]
MDLKKLITRKGILFLIIFSVLVFIGDQINFSSLIGAEGQYFTVFQFFGPIAGFFLGPVVGVLAVLIAEIGSFVVLGKALTIVSVLRLLPMLFAAWYFGAKKDKASMIIPAAAMILFIVHPVGQQVWFYSLYWLIPIVVKVLPAKYSNNAFLKGLGATFTAHAVGSIVWLYFINSMTPAAWVGLIPIVAFERILFASGIAVSFIVLNTLLDKLDLKLRKEYVNVDKNYVLFKRHA